MERIIRGIMRYRHTTREQMVKEFVQVKNNPHVSRPCMHSKRIHTFKSSNNLIEILTFSQPKAVFFTCMDSRMIPTRFTETHVGDMFVGN